MTKKIAYLFIAVLGIITGCRKDDNAGNSPEKPDTAAPKLISSTPADGTTGLNTGNLTVTLTFDMSVLCPTKERVRITLSGGGKIESIDAYAETISVRISGLEYSASCTLTFPKGTVTSYKNNAAEEISISFSTKDRNSQALHPEGLCNPAASTQAKKLYDFLVSESGEHTLTGVQSGTGNSNDFVDLVYKNTGRHPALAGYDFIHIEYSPTPESWSWVVDYGDISAAREHWNAGGIVNYMWHWNVPDSEADWKKGTDNYDFTGYAFNSDKTSFDINEALKEGTWQHEFIMKDMEKAAGYLKLLQEAGIPVIWRPLHEAAGNYDKYGSNGAWFWWGRGGAEPCKALWKLMYDRFVNVYGLDNLIWVWTVDVTEGCEEQYADWYPGDEYVDIVGVDIYEKDVDAKNRQYNALYELTGGRKLITISECGNIPDPAACMEAENRWSWFMVWPIYDKSGSLTLTPETDDKDKENWMLNTLQWWKSVMDSPLTINREDMPDLK